MYFEIEKQAIDAISDALDKFEVDDTLENFQVEDEKNFRLEFPPNPDMGDLASTIAFSLAKKLRKAPNLIASEIVEKLEIPEIFEKVEAIGPYVNFFIDYSAFSKKLLEYVGSDSSMTPPTSCLCTQWVPMLPELSAALLLPACSCHGAGNLRKDTVYNG